MAETERQRRERVARETYGGVWEQELLVQGMEIEARHAAPKEVEVHKKYMPDVAVGDAEVDPAAVAEFDRRLAIEVKAHWRHTGRLPTSERVAHYAALITRDLEHEAEVAKLHKGPTLREVCNWLDLTFGSTEIPDRLREHFQPDSEPEPTSYSIPQPIKDEFALAHREAEAVEAAREGVRRGKPYDQDTTDVKWHQWAARTVAEYCDGFTEDMLARSGKELRADLDRLLGDLTRGPK